MLWFAIDTKSLKSTSVFINGNSIKCFREPNGLALFHSYVLRVSMFRDSGKKEIAKGEIDKTKYGCNYKGSMFRTDLMFLQLLGQ